MRIALIILSFAYLILGAGLLVDAFYLGNTPEAAYFAAIATASVTAAIISMRIATSGDRIRYGQRCSRR